MEQSVAASPPPSASPCCAPYDRVAPPLLQVLEHGDNFIGCSETTDSQSKSSQADCNSRRAALLEGAMTSSINHPNVCATYDYRVVHLGSETPASFASSSSLRMNRVVQETQIIMEFCDCGSLQVRPGLGWWVGGWAPCPCS